MRLPPGAWLAAAGTRSRSQPGIPQSDQRPLRRRKARACSARCATTGSTPSAPKQKDAMQKRIMQGWPFTPEEQRADSGLLRRRRRRPAPPAAARSWQMPEFDLGVALYHGEFAAVSALMEHHGVPIDMEIFPQLADKDIWRAVRDAMVPAIDAQYGVYVRDAAGDWTFNMERFAAYLDARRHRRLAAARNRQAQHEAQDLRGHVARAVRSSRSCASYATRATRCARSSWRSAPTAAIARCCGRSRPRHRARSRRRRSGSSRRRCGCAR